MHIEQCDGDSDLTKISVISVSIMIHAKCFKCIEKFKNLL